MALTDPNDPNAFDPFAAPVFDEDAFLAAVTQQAAPVVVVPPLEAATTLGPRGRTGVVDPPPPPPPPPPTTSTPGRGRIPEATRERVGQLPSGATTVDEVAAAPVEVPPYAVASESPPTVSLPFAADATSGVDQAPPDDAFASTSPTPTERPIEEEQDPTKQAQRWVDYSRTDPEGFQTAMLAHDNARQDEVLKQREAIERDDRMQAERARQRVLDAQVRADEMAKQVEIDAAELAKQKVDPNRWWSDRSVPQKIAGFVAAIVGGLAQSASGGRNVGLDMINQAIDQDIEAQKVNIANGRADLARRQGVVAEMYARTGDLERSVESARRAAKEQALQKLETEMMKFDRNGTAARSMAQQILAGRAQLAQANEKWRQQQFENGLKTGELAIKADEQQRKWQELADKRAKAGGPKKLEDQPLDLATLRGMGIAIPEGVQLPATGITLKQARTLSETGASSQDWNKKIRENSPEERNRQFAVGELVDVDGKPLQFRSAETASKVAKASSSADLSVQLIDRLLDAREQYGWSSDLFKSPEWREMQSDFAQLILEKKTLDELGVIAGPDMDLMQKALGTKDPTELRDPTSGLERIRNTTIEKTNSLIRAEAGGQKPKRWSPPARAPKAPKSAGDVEFQQLKAYTPGRAGGTVGELGLDPNDPQFQTKLAGAINEDAPLLPSVKARVDRIHALANSPKASKDERDAARAQLIELGKTAEFPALRNYAGNLSMMVIGGGE